MTGSYIPTAETESALPVTVYTAEVLQKQGANTPVEGLRQLPSFVGNATTENDSNGGNGSAGINLRGIGQQNALVLINGRRAFLGADNNTSPDINAIPISALARTEVLKDGASAIYGSDAVAGVVNFVLINGPGEAPYEGAEINLLYGNTSESDAHVRQAYIKGGVKTDKVAIAASAEYYSRANLYSRDRFQLAGTGDLSNNPTGLGRGGNNGNSATFSGRVTISGVVTLPDGRKIGGASVLIDPTTTDVTPASYRRFEPTAGQIAATGPQPGDFPPAGDPSRFNFRAFTPAIPAVEKAIWYATGRYKIFGDELQLYGDVMYAKTKQDNGLAPSPFSLGNGTGITSAQTSQFNPFAVGGAVSGVPGTITNLSYRLVNELGNRRSFFDHDYWRYTVGFNGDFNFQGNSFISHLGYDTGLVYERYDELRIDSGDATRTALLGLIDGGIFDPFIGQNAPATGTAPIYNNTNPAGANYRNGVSIGTAPYNNAQAGALQENGGAQYIGHSLFNERSWLGDAKVNAHLFPNLWNGGIDLAVGYEHREDAQHSIPDPVQAAGDQLGFNQAPNFKFLQKVDSVFLELNVPIVTSTMNVPFVRSLEVSIAWRYENFENKDEFTHATSAFENKNPDEDFGGSPRLSIRYQPIPDVTLRANFNQSYRAPRPIDLFVPVTQNFPVLFDPLTGVTGQPPGGTWQGSNPNLIPETTDSYSAGIVYTPKWLPGFTITADWYQLYTTNLILDPVSFAQVLVSTNVIDPDGFGNGSGAAAGPGGPGLGVTRDAFGNLLAVDTASGNAGTRFVQGLDITAVYELPTVNWGTFTFSAGLNHFITWKAQADPTVGPFNFLGDFAAAIPLAPGAIPFNKGFLRSEWAWKGLDFVATVNYIGDYEDDPSFIQGNDTIPPRGTDNGGQPSWVLHHRVSDYETLDLQLSYEFVKPKMEPAGYSKDAKDAKSMVAGVENNGSFWNRMLWGTKLTVGCNNVFDRYPPTTLGAFNDNYDTSLYSIRNRFYYISLNKKF